MTTLYEYITQGGRKVTHLDEADEYTADDVRASWAATLPELSQATSTVKDEKQTVEVDGREVEVDKVVTFAKRVGTKGASNALAEFEAAKAEFDKSVQTRLEAWGLTDPVRQPCPRCQAWMGRDDQQMVCQACNHSEPLPVDVQLREAGATLLPGLEGF